MCNTCGNNNCYNEGSCVNTASFNDLYATYYAKLSGLIGGKFWPGNGLAQNQFPVVDTTQYLNYIDVSTGNFYRYNITTTNWDFLFSLQPLINSLVITGLQQEITGGSNINISPTASGIQIAVTGLSTGNTVSAGTNVAVVHTGSNYAVSASGVAAGSHVFITNDGNGNFVVNGNSPGPGVDNAVVLGSGSTVAVNNTSTLETVTGRGATTDHPVTFTNTATSNLFSGTQFRFTAAPSLYADAAGFQEIIYDTTSLTFATKARNTVLLGASGTTPPTTGSFYRGDLYLAG